MTSHQNNIWTRQDTIGILSLRGSKGNYLDSPDFTDLNWLNERMSEPGLKGIILRGSGRHFSAGADMDRLKELARNKELLFDQMSAGKEIIKALESASLPVIAEISGICFGGGLEIALACHVRICSVNALFAFPEVNWNIMPGLGGTVFLPGIVGHGKAVKIILSGDTMNATEAKSLNLVDYVVPSVELGRFCMDYLKKLTDERDDGVIRSVMKSIHNSLHMDLNSALEEETRLFCELAVKKLDE